MTRPADLTRQALITAALAVFAEKGFTAGSVRDITRRAKANGAAVNYHFGGKEGLYREVLRNALAAFENNARVDDAEAETLPRREALARFVRQQLVPLTKRDQFSRYLRLFAWEQVSASDVFATSSPPRSCRSSRPRAGSCAATCRKMRARRSWPSRPFG